MSVICHICRDGICTLRTLVLCFLSLSVIQWHAEFYAYLKAMKKKRDGTRGNRNTIFKKLSYQHSKEEILTNVLLCTSYKWFSITIFVLSVYTNSPPLNNHSYNTRNASQSNYYLVPMRFQHVWLDNMK